MKTMMKQLIKRNAAMIAGALALFVATAIVALTVPAEADLILHYPMNEASWPGGGSAIEDMSPTQENDGGVHAAATQAPDRFGNPNEALSKTGGVSIHIDNTNGVDTTTTNEFSIASWYKGTDPNGYFFDQESSRFVLQFDSTNGLGVYHAGGWYQTGNTTYLDGEWHHVAFVFDNDTTDSFFSIYVDGTAIDVDPVTGGVQTTLTMTGRGIANLTQQGTNYRQRFGSRYSTASSNILDGLYDDIRIYDTALSAGEVMELYLVPEPSALCLGAIGLLSLLGFGRRKRRKEGR